MKIHPGRTRVALPLLMLAVMLAALPAGAEEYGARIMKVVNCATFEVSARETTKTFRLAGIDCPKKGNASASLATEASTALTAGVYVYVVEDTRDHAGIPLGRLYLPDGTNLSYELLRRGLATYDGSPMPYDVLKRIARFAQRQQVGMWSKTTAVANDAPAKPGESG